MASPRQSLLWMVPTVLFTVSLGYTTGTDLEICPGVMDCTHDAVDVLISFTQLPESHVSGVRNISECQQFCLKAKHTYYRYLPRPQPKKGLCYCFNACESLVIGGSTVGLVSACRASAEVALRAQQHQELQEWDLPLQGSAFSSSSSSSSVSSSSSSGATAAAMVVASVAEQQKVERKRMEEGVEEKEKTEKERMEEGVLEFLRVQQRAQLRSQKSVGWQVLQKTQELLRSAQLLFLEKEQQQNKEQEKEQQQNKEQEKEQRQNKEQEKEQQQKEQQKERRNAAANANAAGMEGKKIDSELKPRRAPTVDADSGINQQDKPIVAAKVGSLDTGNEKLTVTEKVEEWDIEKAAGTGQQQIVSSRMELDDLAEQRVAAAAVSEKTEVKGESAALSREESMRQQDRLVRQLMDE